MGPLGFPELILIFGVALLVFGPRKLPDIGRSVGRALGEFRRATHDLKTTLEEEVRLEDNRAPLSVVRDPLPQPPSTPTVSRGRAAASGEPPSLEAARPAPPFDPASRE